MRRGRSEKRREERRGRSEKRRGEKREEGGVRRGEERSEDMNPTSYGLFIRVFSTLTVECLALFAVEECSVSLITLPAR